MKTKRLDLYRAQVLAVAIGFLAVHGECSAAAYKCSDAGKVIYQQTPCPAGTTSQKLGLAGTGWFTVLSREADGVRQEILLDEAGIKHMDRYYRATFKITMKVLRRLTLKCPPPAEVSQVMPPGFSPCTGLAEGSELTIEPEELKPDYFVTFYDCGAGAMSMVWNKSILQETNEAALAKVTKTVFPYERFRKDHVLETSFAQPDVVARVCESASK